MGHIQYHILSFVSPSPAPSSLVFNPLQPRRYYTNRHHGPEPPLSICLTQASLIYGAPPMYARCHLTASPSSLELPFLLSGSPLQALLSLYKYTSTYVNQHHTMITKGTLFPNPQENHPLRKLALISYYVYHTWCLPDSPLHPPSSEPTTPNP